jgi:hypothetical protein
MPDTTYSATSDPANGAPKLKHEAFGKETIFHSKSAANAHAAAGGGKAIFVGNVDSVPEKTDSETNPGKYGLGLIERPDPNAAPAKPAVPDPNAAPAA